MKRFFSVFIVILIFAGSVFAHQESIMDDIADGPICLNDKDYKFENNRIIIYPKDSKYSSVVITDEYDLYVDNFKINVNYSTKKLLKIYYNQVFDIRDEAIEIGLAGAKIGITGAKLGLTAVASLPLLLFGGSDEYEARIEEASEAIEEKAEELEERGEELEDQADELEDLEDELKDRIEELNELHWF